MGVQLLLFFGESKIRIPFLRVKDYLEKMSSKIQSVPENVANGLQTLRTEQRSLASKLSELQMDLNEHKLVIDTLEKVGGVLVERSVGEVQPALTGNRDKLTKLIETLEKQLTEKGQEINGYIEKHNIQIQGKKGPTTSNAPAVEENKKTQSTGVLV